MSVFKVMELMTSFIFKTAKTSIKLITICSHPSGANDHIHTQTMLFLLVLTFPGLWMLSAILMTTLNNENRIAVLEEAMSLLTESDLYHWYLVDLKATKSIPIIAIEELKGSILKSDTSLMGSSVTIDQLLLGSFLLAFTVGILFFYIIKPRSKDDQPKELLSGSSIDYDSFLDIINTCYLSDVGSSDNLLSLPLVPRQHPGHQKKALLCGEELRSITSSSLKVEGKGFSDNCKSPEFSADNGVLRISGTTQITGSNESQSAPLLINLSEIATFQLARRHTWSSEKTPLSGELEYKINKAFAADEKIVDVSLNRSPIHVNSSREREHPSDDFDHQNISASSSSRIPRGLAGKEFYDDLVFDSLSFRREHFQSRLKDIDEVLAELAKNPSHSNITHVISGYLMIAMDDSQIPEVRLSGIDFLRYLCLFEAREEIDPLTHRSMLQISEVMESVLEPTIENILLLIANDDYVPINLFLLVTDFFAYNTTFPTMLQLRLILEKYSTYLNGNAICTANVGNLVTAIDVESFISFCNLYPEHLNKYTSRLHIRQLCYNKNSYWDQPERATVYMSFLKTVVLRLEIFSEEIARLYLLCNQLFVYENQLPQLISKNIREKCMLPIYTHLRFLSRIGQTKEREPPVLIYPSR